MNVGHYEYSDWEYHPAYGIWSRVLYFVIGKDVLRYVKRVYARTNVE